MNSAKPSTNSSAGTTDVPGQTQGPMGTVKNHFVGFWNVIEASTNDYVIDRQLQAGSIFTATLT